jgi:uncharacterized protein involved in cysteine biosynthesis
MTPGTGVRIQRIERRSWILAGVLLAASLFFLSREVTAGVALGAGLAMLNFKGLRTLVTSLVESGRRRPPRWILVLSLLKYSLTGVAIFLGIKYDFANVLALLAGVSVIFLSICWEGVSAHRRMKEGADHAVEF